MSEHAADPLAARARRRFVADLIRLARGGTAGALALALDIALANAATVLAVRVWPSRDYTRVTLELDEPLKFSHTLMADPMRLVVDLEGIDVDVALRELLAKVQPDDPYIQQVRVGQYKPRVMRLVFDLKSATAPQLFTLPPIANYRHRLVLDLFPVVPVDPLQTLLEEVRARDNSAAQIRNDPIGSLIRERDPAHPAAPKAPPPPLATSEPTPSLPGEPPAARAPAPNPANAATNRAPIAPPSAALANAPDTAMPYPEPPRHTNRSRKPAVTRMVTIAIDPGHGGEDPGAIGRMGTREKDVVLAVARTLRERIRQEPNMRAFLTRDADYFVPLPTRVEKARRVQADLFVSIHADAFVRPHARGASVYVLSERGATSTAARWLANKENQADLIGGVDITRRNREAARILLEMATASQIRDSSSLGRIVLAELGGIGELHKNDIEQAGFAVLKAPDIPSILVETAFISNPHEERRLANRAYQARLGEAIFKGIRRYFVKFPPPGGASRT